jgi:hypothetical protein
LPPVTTVSLLVAQFDSGQKPVVAFGNVSLPETVFFPPLDIFSDPPMKRHHLSFVLSILQVSTMQMEIKMIWMAAMVLGMSFMLLKLGALSVWVGILWLALRIALLVVAGLAGLLLWKRIVRA